MKEKAGNLDFTKIQNFCSVKDAIKIANRPQNGENVCKTLSDETYSKYKKTFKMK